MTSHKKNMLDWTPRSLRGFVTDISGLSAIEFGFAAPMISIMLVGMIEVGSLALDRSDMHTAARSGVQYFMSGGSNHDNAREVVIQSWDSIPEDAVVAVEPFCLCGWWSVSAIPCAGMAIFRRCMHGLNFREPSGLI